MSDTRPSATSMPPPPKGPSRWTLLLLILLFGGGTLAVYKLLLEKPERPHERIEAPPPVERPTALTTAEPEPPPLPQALAPAEDAGASKTKRRAGGGGCTGDVNAAAVKAYAQGHMGPLRTCYERRLKVNNMLMGRIVLGMTIQPSGAVSSTNVVQDSVHDSEVTSCVRQSVARWRMPAPTGGCVHVEYPFSFSPSQGR